MNMNTLFRCIALWFGVSSLAFAQSAQTDQLDPIDAESIGKVVSCSICHGANGEGNEVMSAPLIGGMEEWYLSRQLRNFRLGIRGGTYEDVYGTQMRAMALALDDLNEVDELSRYLASLAPPPAESSLSGNPERGKQLYAVCSACHGANGKGSKQMNSPDLTAQYDWYLVRQLNNFSNGLRGANEDDIHGQQMVPIMQTLPDKQAINDVVAYIKTL